MTHSGGKEHAVGDRGQRYEVRAIGWPGKGEGVIGWNESRDGAESTAASIRKAPGCTSAWVVDRRPVASVPADDPDVVDAAFYCLRCGDPLPQDPEAERKAREAGMCLLCVEANR